jgi:hypothetical protein
MPSITMNVEDLEIGQQATVPIMGRIERMPDGTTTTAGHFIAARTEDALGVLRVPTYLPFGMRCVVEEVLVVERVAIGYSFSREDGSDGETPVRVAFDQSTQLKKYHRGHRYQAHVAAPGIGYREYKVTRIDRDGLWGVLLRDTVRELTADDVR